MEQKYLKWVFSLRKELCYNLLPIAGSPLGVVRSEETRAKISETMTGANNPIYGRTGANHPNPPPGGCMVNLEP